MAVEWLPGDGYGYSVALSADGVVAAIGCPYRDDSGSRTDTGSVFVYMVGQRGSGVDLLATAVHQCVREMTSCGGECRSRLVIGSPLCCLAAHGHDVGRGPGDQLCQGLGPVVGQRDRRHQQVRTAPCGPLALHCVLHTETAELDLVPGVSAMTFW